MSVLRERVTAVWLGLMVLTCVATWGLSKDLLSPAVAVVGIFAIAGVKVSYVMPGSVATGFGGRADHDGSDWKIWPEDVAEIVRMLLKMPVRTLISRVEVRPLKTSKMGPKR